MTDQKLPQDQAVHAPRYAFEAMAAYSALDEDKVAVMLLLLVRMDRNRAVTINTGLLPDFLTVRSERVDHAISSLIRNGWVHSVDEEAMRRRVLDCVVHSAFVNSDFDTLMRELLSRRVTTV